MSQRQLSGLDAAFWFLEGPGSPMQVGMGVVLDPPEGRRALFSAATRFEQIRSVFASRLHLVEPMRQRLITPLFGMGATVFADDPAFDLDDHLHRLGVPAPGGHAELEELFAEFMAEPLDPDKPLWEVAVVEGLEHDRTAVFVKLHHSIIDGISGAGAMANFFDLSPRQREVEPPAHPFEPDDLPGPTDLAVQGAASLLRQVAAGLGALTRTVEHAAEVAEAAVAPGGLGAQLPILPFSAPRSPVSGHTSSMRRYRSVEFDLARLKEAARRYDATVTEVTSAMVGGALRRWMAEHGGVPEHDLTALVPITVDALRGGNQLGNYISAMFVNLGVNVADPVERIAVVKESARRGKEGDAAFGGHLMTDIAEAAGPLLSTGIARLAYGARLFDVAPAVANVVVSSVPGPDFPLYMAGSRVAELMPAGPLQGGTGINVTLFSHEGRLAFGLLACKRLVPDLELIRTGLVEVAGALDLGSPLVHRVDVGLEVGAPEG